MTPDHVPCRHCAEPISWDEVCWVHDSTGFADCGLVISGGQEVRDGMGELVASIGPTMTLTRPVASKAEPEGEWS